MPVIVRFANIEAGKCHGAPVTTATALLQGSCSDDYERCEAMIKTSFQSIPDNTFTSKNGFVYVAYEAYSNHHHLTIRPEDVWFAIITQLSFYINANAEELRSFFVSHEGKEEIVIRGTDILAFDWGRMAVKMTEALEEFLKQPDLRKWIMPNFSTTTPTDEVTAAVIMMGTLQHYFSYKAVFTCGIPSATLLGEKSDWEDIRRRLEFLPKLCPPRLATYAHKAKLSPST